MSRRFFALLLLFFLYGAIPSEAQNRFLKRSNVGLGFNHHNADGTLTSGFNLGIFNDLDSLRGFQVGLFSSGTRSDMRGINIGGLLSVSRKNASGVQIGGLISGTGGRMHGVQIATVSNVVHEMRGLQISGFSNISTSPLHGLQISPFTNISMGVKRGSQISMLANISSSMMRGLQLGLHNYADTLSGSQVGIVNVALRHPHGVQIGIVNYSLDESARKIGLVNINPETDIDFLTFVGNTSKFNGAARFRNKSTYSIIGLGTHYMGLDENFSGALFYRWGKWFNLSPRWAVSGDVGYSHIETFEENSKNKPERLFSLQLHANLEYQLNKTLGLFASVGYGNTRSYNHLREYKHNLILQAGLSFAYHRKPHTPEQEIEELEASCDTDSPSMRLALPQPKRYWLAAIEATGINAMVFSFDRFIMNEDFAQVNINTIRDNLKTGFVWDNDPFATNLFAHPYHGNLYFNAARSNGLSFWESMPYAIGGSLMWELFAECEPPAINDWMATSLGGTCIGEITNRISHLILNDSKSGGARFWREAAAFIVNPIQGFNRILHGDAWMVHQDHALYHDYDAIPVSLNLSLGNRYLADDGGLFRGENNPYLGVYLEYGDPFNSETNQPYDYFTADLTIGLTGNQPLLNSAHLLGRLWGKNVHEDDDVTLQLGIFQHFNFYNSMPVKNGTTLTPYRISEAVAFGPGAIYRFHGVGNMSKLEQQMYIDAIMLGGSKSDYYNVIDRDYNMGSGFSFKTKTMMAFRSFGHFNLNVDYYRIFTWKGYEDKDLTNTDPLHYNVQGDKSNAELFVINPKFSFNMKNNLNLEVSSSYFVRKTRYYYHDNVSANTFEFKVGVSYML